MDEMGIEMEMVLGDTATRDTRFFVGMAVAGWEKVDRAMMSMSVSIPYILLPFFYISS